VINVHRVPMAYGDRYEMNLTSSFDEITSSYNLSTEKNNKKNAEKIERIMKYIASNRTVLAEWYEITPKMYQVVVIRE